MKAAQRTTVDGITFHSKREAKRYSELRMLEKAGLIADLRLQVRIPLQGNLTPIRTPTGKVMTYVADFTYLDKRLGSQPVLVIEDAKGHQTDTYKIKKAILEAMGLEIRET